MKCTTKQKRRIIRYAILLAISLILGRILSARGEYVVLPAPAPESPANGQFGAKNAEIIAVLATLDTKTLKIITDLVQCESRWNPKARNPNDLDHTPSYGLGQFKPATYLHYGKTYGVFPSTSTLRDAMEKIYDGPTQVRVLGPMIRDNWKNEAFWRQQFPACSKKHNYWK